MKLIYVFLGIFSLKIVCMDKPLPPFNVKKAAAAWPPKPAAAGFLAKRSATSLKRSSDEEGEIKSHRRRRKSLEGLDTVMPDALKLDAKSTAQTLVDSVRTEIEKEQLRIISSNPPICEVVLESVKWECRYCGREFNNKEIERVHIRDLHGIIPAAPEQEWGIAWSEINKMKDYIRHSRPSTPPLSEDQQENDEEEEVEEIM